MLAYSLSNVLEEEPAFALPDGCEADFTILLFEEHADYACFEWSQRAQSGTRGIVGGGGIHMRGWFGWIGIRDCPPKRHCATPGDTGRHRATRGKSALRVPLDASG